ncbi:MAG: ion transporter [Phycisphaeraceae bacterium]|nr:MAG: ion transporter [Phycisphaeraceae bacterium]
MTTETTHAPSTRLSRLTEDPRFNAASVAVILINAALIGASTYTDAGWIVHAERACVALFTTEIVLRFLSARSARAYLRDGWNVFDVVIVTAAFIPAWQGVAPVVRILRVLRILRLVKALPELRMIVDVLIRSTASMKHITALAALSFYVFATIGVKVFGSQDPGNPLREEYATIHEACFTLFRVLTGDNWTDLRYEAAAFYGPHAWIVTGFHVLWIVIATFLLINLIVGAIINNYQEVQEIEHRRRQNLDTSDRRLAELAEEMREILALRDAGRRG